jgi:CRISPR-associated endoribonuclease Cas6
MRIKVKLAGKEEIKLPVGFNEYIQALIYNHIDKDSAEWLHNRGFCFEKRSFKLFIFSSILERGFFDKNTRTFTFPEEISFYISSPVDWILEQIATNLIKSEIIKLGQNELQVLSIAVIKHDKIKENSVKINAITPIETHSTFKKPDGRKITHYYTPFEKEFGELIDKNLKKKWTAFYKKECPHNITIKPLFKGNRNERIVYFGAGEKKTLIKGWKGHFLLESGVDLLQFALNVGLGSRNSQGFGMIEML